MFYRCRSRGPVRAALRPADRVALTRSSQSARSRVAAAGPQPDGRRRRPAAGSPLPALSRLVAAAGQPGRRLVATAGRSAAGSPLPAHSRMVAADGPQPCRRCRPTAGCSRGRRRVTAGSPPGCNRRPRLHCLNLKLGQRLVRPCP